MKSQIITLDMNQPGAEKALAAWGHIDPIERAKWAKKPDTRTLEEVDAELTAALAKFRR